VKFTDSIKEKLLSALAGGLITLAALTGGSFLKETYQPLLTAVLPAVSKTSLALLCLLLLTICLVSVPWLIALLFAGKERDKVETLKEKYDFLPDRAFYKDKKSDMFICSNCLLNGMESPLAKTYNHGQAIWRCTNKGCFISYPRPDEE